MSKWGKIRHDFRKATKELNKFARLYAPKVKCRLDGEFSAEKGKRINYSIVLSPKETKWFCEDFIRRYPAAKGLDAFTLSFLHELGHIVTWDDMIDDCAERVALAKKKSNYETNMAYFKLYNERLATDWAGTFITENPTYIRDFEATILRKLEKAWRHYDD